MTEQALYEIKTRDYFACENNFDKVKDIASELVYGSHRSEAPRFTVVIPTYRKPELLALALQSTFVQPGEDYQVMVVDDDPESWSSGRAAAILERFADERLLYYVNRQNLGLFANWNRCFELAASEWVVMLHDDDLLTEDYLTSVRRALDAAGRIDFLSVTLNGFQIRPDLTEAERKALCAAPEQPFPRVLRPVSMAQLQYGPGVVWQGSCIRRSAFLEMGGAQLGSRLVAGEPRGAYYSQDYCMMVRFAHRFACYRLARPLYRVGSGANSSRNVWEWQDALVEQYYCGRSVAQQYRILGWVGALAVQEKLMKLVQRYNSGDSYIRLEVGIDEALLKRECGLPENAPGAAAKAAEKLWSIRLRLQMLASHRKDIRIPAE